MTVCNMAIEAGARAGLVGRRRDDDRLRARAGPVRPPGSSGSRRLRYWRTLRSDAGAHLDRVVELDAGADRAAGHLGHVAGDGRVDRRPRAGSRSARRTPASATRSSARCKYMALEPNKRDRRHPHRQGLHRLVHQLAHRGPARGRRRGAPARRPDRRATSSSRWSCRAPGLVKEQAEREGLDAVFKAAGFEWREPGCSMCLAMNADRLEPGERCASTSNRNFEGRQGAGGRTHLVSPAMAAAAAIEGHFVDVRRWSELRPARSSSYGTPFPHSTPAWSRRWTGRTSTPTRSSRSSS